MNSEDLRRGLTTAEVEALRQQAWIGDAVLELYARTLVLGQTGQRDVNRKVRFVRNAFLNHLGQPTRVEAEIGRHYQDGGLDPAFAWIERNIQPLFLKQEANLARKKKQHAPGKRLRQR
jgi:hypothetical protein